MILFLILLGSDRVSLGFNTVRLGRFSDSGSTLGRFSDSTGACRHSDSKFIPCGGAHDDQVDTLEPQVVT